MLGLQGQCARNHRLNSICFFHYQESHEGDWKSCQRCVDSFTPYDYAVKAATMWVMGFAYGDGVLLVVMVQCSF